MDEKLDYKAREMFALTEKHRELSSKYFADISSFCNNNTNKSSLFADIVNLSSFLYGD